MKNIEMTELERKKLTDAGRQSIACTHGWRPIETAPKDGTLVLVYNTLNNGTITSINGKIAVARYGHQNDDLEESLWEYGTYYSENSKDNQGAYLISATHWMPLPAPPPKESE